MLAAGLRPRKESTASSASVASSQNISPNGRSRTRAKSPTGYSTTTAASELSFANGIIITRADLRSSIAAYEDLVGALKSYRSALSTLSHASASVARALEQCSRLKGVSDDAARGLQAAGGLHHVIANHEQVLSRSLQENVQYPLRQHLDSYKLTVAERSAAYERTLMEKSRIIRQTEKENLNSGRRKTRDLNTFRNALTMLQNQVDDLDRLKAEYYESVLAHEEQIWDGVLNKVAYSVRTSLDVYDRITAKSSDPTLEPLLLTVPDPFDMYGPPKSEAEIFSILPPLGMTMNLSSQASLMSSPHAPSNISPSTSAHLSRARVSPTLSISTSAAGWFNTALNPSTPTKAKATASTTAYTSDWIESTSKAETTPTTRHGNGVGVATLTGSSPRRPSAESRLRSVLTSAESTASEDDSSQNSDAEDTETETDGGARHKGRLSRNGTIRSRKSYRRPPPPMVPPDPDVATTLWGKEPAAIINGR